MKSGALVSVVVSAYNAEMFIAECIDSILNQTYDNFELLITDDASDDKTVSIIGSYQDERITLFKNAARKGLTFNLNRMIEKAKGKYIARIDADDINYPDRIREQVEYLETHTGCQMVCGFTTLFGLYKGTHKFPTSPEMLSAKQIFENNITHSSVMMKRDLNYLYDERFIRAQDYELWDRMLADGKRIGVIPHPVVYCRWHAAQITTNPVTSAEQAGFAAEVKSRALKRLVPDLTEEERTIYFKYQKFGRTDNAADFRKLINILGRAYSGGRIEKGFSRLAMHLAMANLYRGLLATAGQWGDATDPKLRSKLLLKSLSAQSVKAWLVSCRQKLK